MPKPAAPTIVRLGSESEDKGEYNGLTIVRLGDPEDEASGYESVGRTLSLWIWLGLGLGLGLDLGLGICAAVRR